MVNSPLIRPYLLGGSFGGGGGTLDSYEYIPSKMERYFFGHPPFVGLDVSRVPHHEPTETGMMFHGSGKRLGMMP